MKYWRTAGIGIWAISAAVMVLRFASPGRAAEGVEQSRSVGHFDHVRTEGMFRTQIAAGSTAQHVSIGGDPAVVARVTTTIEGDTLVIGMKPGTNLFDKSPSVTIAVPALRGYANSGAGSARITGLTGDVSLSNDGTASITASGRAAHLAIELDGIGKIDTTAVDARDVTVDNNGVGRVDVRASGSLTMNVNGVGEIRYAGSPASIDQHVNGVGRIRRL
jgi:hypothetical protein